MDCGTIASALRMHAMRFHAFLYAPAAMLLALGFAYPTLAKVPCPKRPIGSLAYPWLIEGYMDGDHYADIYLDVSKDGEPVACRFGKTNIHSNDEKFGVCLAFMRTRGWSVNPSTPEATRTTITRKYISYGGKHEKAERAARKLYLAQHPEERPECFPDS
jgi:hypothetical protein